MQVEYRRADLSIDQQLAVKTPKPWTDEVVRAGLDVDDVRPIRDEIERRVRSLLAELDVAAPARQVRRKDAP